MAALLIALGGNTLEGGIAEQAATLKKSLAGVAELARRGPVVITHGNGPQVGHILNRVEAARGRAYPLPLDVCVAQSQGETGYLIQQALQDLTGRPAAVVVTRVVVDPAPVKPTKPVGPFLSKTAALALGAPVVEDAGRGWRRVVPSPRPLRTLDAPAVRALLYAGIVVVAAGGGGIPVTESGAGVEAVIDKDRASALLARELGITHLLDLTGVEFVYLDFLSERRRPIRSMTAAEARRHLEAGEFLPGSMGPKVEAAIGFLEAGGEEVVITDPPHAVDGLEGRTGTRLTP